jgi:hypothetical protein
MIVLDNFTFLEHQSKQKIDSALQQFFENCNDNRLKNEFQRELFWTLQAGLVSRLSKAHI